MKHEVLIILNIAAPYRVDFLNELSLNQEIKVVFEQSKTTRRNKSWLGNDKIKFSHYFIDNKISNILKVLNDISKHEKIILGGYATPLSIIFIIWMKILRKKFILNADGGFIKKESILLKKFKTFLISSAEYWLSTGNYTNKYLEYYGANAKNIFIYPFSSVRQNEINLISQEEKVMTRSDLKMNYDFNVLYVGSFIKRKNVEVLIKTALKFNNVGFYFIGGKPSEEYLAISQNKNNIFFINHLSKENLSKYYRAVDIFVFPTSEDIWGLVINEAMSQGLPVVTTDKCIAGLEMIETNMCGEIVPVDINSNELAEIIKSFFSNNGKFNSEEIIEVASKYTIESMAAKHIEILKKIYIKKE